MKSSDPKNSKFFTTAKNKTDPFFRQTKVDSCSHVLVKNGQSLAVPFKITNQKGYPLQHYSFAQSKSSEAKSVYRKDYTPKPFMHAGMGKKPLVTYHPDSYRNRLPVGGIIMPLKNKSLVEIGDRGYIRVFIVDSLTENNG
jgi:hypothetical protein